MLREMGDLKINTADEAKNNHDNTSNPAAPKSVLHKIVQIKLAKTQAKVGLGDHGRAASAKTKTDHKRSHNR